MGLGRRLPCSLGVRFSRPFQVASTNVIQTGTLLVLTWPCSSSLMTLGVLTPEGWRPGVGDPTVAGWTIAGLYFLAAVAAWWARRVGREGALAARRWEGIDRRRTDRASAYRARSLFWFALLIICTLLGVNKQLDLQAWVTDELRTMAVEQGWHEQRRVAQAIVVTTVGVAAVLGLAAVVVVTRRLLPRHAPAFFGLSVLLVYAALRMVSYHHVDALLRQRTWGWRHGEFVEATAVLCIAVCAALTSRWWLPARARRAV